MGKKSKNMMLKDQNRREQKDSKYPASPQLHSISRCCDLVAFFLWPDVRSAALWLNPMFTTAGCFSWQQKKPAWHCHRSQVLRRGGSKRLGTHMLVLASKGVNSRCMHCVTYIQYIMGFSIFRSL